MRENSDIVSVNDTSSSEKSEALQDQPLLPSEPERRAAEPPGVRAETGNETEEENEDDDEHPQVESTNGSEDPLRIMSIMPETDPRSAQQTGHPPPAFSG